MNTREKILEWRFNGPEIHHFIIGFALKMIIEFLAISLVIAPFVFILISVLGFPVSSIPAVPDVTVTTAGSCFLLSGIGTWRNRCLLATGAITEKEQ